MIIVIIEDDISLLENLIRLYLEIKRLKISDVKRQLHTHVWRKFVGKHANAQKNPE